MSIRSFVASAWLLSFGVSAGALLVLPPEARLYCFALFAILETAHTFAPISVAWANREFRRTVVYRQWTKFIVLPMAVFLSVSGAGAATSMGWTSYDLGQKIQIFRITDWRNPFPFIAWAYFVWNVYHYGMQNFGVASLFQGKRADPILWLGATVVVMAVIPKMFGSGQLLTFLLVAFSVNHWVVDIALSARVTKHYCLFLGIVLVFLGPIGFFWITPTSYAMVIYPIPIIIGARMGLGFVHFLYSGWIWKLSNPHVRATIGEALT